MTWSSTARSRRWSRQTGDAPSSPSDDDIRRLDALLDEHQPSFREAVLADAAAACRYRGERSRFGSRADALVQVLRLCLVTDAFFAQVCYRAKVSCHGRRIVVLPWMLHRLSMMTAQVSIGDKAVLRPGIYIPHGQVVIDGLTLLETGVVLRPFVTLGLRDRGLFGPILRRGVKVGTGAKVIGHLEVGERAEIGANAVVVRDVPAGVTVVGVPAAPVPTSSDRQG